MGLDRVSLVSEWRQLCCRGRGGTAARPESQSSQIHPIVMQINVLQSLGKGAHLTPEGLAEVKDSIILQ